MNLHFQNLRLFKFKLPIYANYIFTLMSVFVTFCSFSQNLYSAKIDEGLLYFSMSDSIYEFTLFKPDTTGVLSYSKGTYQIQNDSINLNSFPEMDDYVVESYFSPTKGNFSPDTCYFIVLLQPVIISQEIEIRFKKRNKNFSFSSKDGLLIKVPKDELNDIKKMVFYYSDYSTYCMQWTNQMHQLANFFFVGINDNPFDWSMFYLQSNLNAFGRQFNFKEALEISNYNNHNCFYSESEIIIPDFKPPGQFKSLRDVVLKRIK